MAVDSHRWLPYGLAAWMRMEWQAPGEPATTPMTPLEKPLSSARFVLLTTGGLYSKGKHNPSTLSARPSNPIGAIQASRSLPRETTN